VTYLITFSCYGAHVHGDESGSVDRKHNMPGTRMLEPNSGRAFAERRAMDQRGYTLDKPRREAVLAAIIDRCSQREWSLIAAHVRTNHVHIIVDGEAPAQRTMNDLKSYSSRVLNQVGFDTPDRKRWTRHGSTRWLLGNKNVDAAIKYVLEKQGDPMATYLAEERR
jgi:REP element-mobilizing transposase RayT